MECRKTHYEQIPVEIAKKVAEAESISEEYNGKKRAWQQVAAELAEERDPSRLIALAKELNDVLEEKAVLQQQVREK
jgi:hypothetical protein